VSKHQSTYPENNPIRNKSETPESVQLTYMDVKNSRYLSYTGGPPHDDLGPSEINGMGTYPTCIQIFLLEKDNGDIGMEVSESKKNKENFSAVQ
jgi:hypothetical protein